MTKAVRLRTWMLVILMAALPLVPLRIYRQRQADRATLALLRSELDAATLDREVAEVAVVEYEEGFRKGQSRGRLRPAQDAAKEETLRQLRESVAFKARQQAASRAKLNDFAATHRGL